MFNQKQLKKLQLISNLVQQKKFEQALKISEELNNKSPKNHVLLNMNGFILFKMKKFDLAYKCFIKSIELNDAFYEAKFNLGRLFFYKEQYSKSIEILNQAIKLNNIDLSAIFYLASAYYKCDQFEEAIDTINSFFASQGKRDKDILTILAKSYYAINKINQAEKIYQELHELDPENIRFLEKLGQIYININNQELAKKYFIKALNLNKNNYPVIYDLYFYTDYDLTDDQIDSFKKLKLDLNNYSSYFCLYKYFETKKNWNDAFYYLKKVTKFLNKKYPFNKTKAEKNFELLKELHDFVKDINLSINMTDYKLIFIVGLPRCGSTMVENVILMNDQSFSLGEDPVFIKLVSKLKDTPILNVENITKIFIEFRQYYFSRIKYRTDKKIIIDKTLVNFGYISLIDKIFPEAKIINLNRNPINQLFSCYRTNFYSKDGLSYTHSLNSLIQMYYIYKNIISFWYEENIKNLIDFNYENLATNKEKYFNDLFLFIGLEFKTSYLNIQNNTNVSKTASLKQVRKKITLSENNFINVYKNGLKVLIEEFDSIIRKNDSQGEP